MNVKASSIILVALFISLFVSAQDMKTSDDITTVRVTNKPKVKNVEPLGVHFNGDNYYNSVILKQRVAENFEGTVRRKHVLGPNEQPNPKGIFLWGMQVDDSWEGATAHMLSGPDQWKEVRVTSIDTVNHDLDNEEGNQETLFLQFDQEVTWSGEGDQAGVLLEKSNLEEGQHPWYEETYEKINGEWEPVVKYNEEYCSPERTSIVTGDVPEESFGVASLKMDGKGGRSFVRFRVQFYEAAPYEGKWKIQFWAKTRGGSPVLNVQPTVPGSSIKVTPGNGWEHYTREIHLEKPDNPEDNPIFMLEVNVNDGEILVDDIEARKIGGNSNPTPFRDELVAVYEDLNPGSVRYLRNTHDAVYNWLMPRLRNYSRGGEADERDGFGTHEFYEFCEYIDANPWANLPGTLLPKDIDTFMEYCGAPADKGKGKLRAELGQKKPWTEVFDKIHVQFGNETITFFGTGFWGPDYWQSLIERAKQSPYYDEDKFVFHVNHQGGGKDLLDMHPGFERFTIGGYHIFGLYEEQIEKAGDVAGFYDFVFASAWHNWMVPKNNKNYPYLKAAKKHDMEVSIYEGGNYHTTFSTPGEVPLERINRMIVGRAGGMSATHTLLLLMKHWEARTMQSFNLSQFSFSPGGAFGNIDGKVRLWGGVLRIGSPEQRRYRPRFQALKIANEVIGGDLVETPHSGANPKFSVTNKFGAGYGPSRNPEQMTVSDIPRIHSYGFKEGDRRGLILVSNDPRKAQDIKIQFDGKPQNSRAHILLLNSENLEDSNEHDWAPGGPEVNIVEKTLNDFESGTVLELPPATMMSVEWEQ